MLNQCHLLGCNHKLCKIRVVWGPRGLQVAYCSKKSFNVTLLLFTGLIVVLLFMFNNKNSVSCSGLRL